MVLEVMAHVSQYQTHSRRVYNKPLVTPNCCVHVLRIPYRPIIKPPASLNRIVLKPNKTKRCDDTDALQLAHLRGHSSILCPVAVLSSSRCKTRASSEDFFSSICQFGQRAFRKSRGPRPLRARTAHAVNRVLSLVVQILSRDIRKVAVFLLVPTYRCHNENKQKWAE